MVIGGKDSLKLCGKDDMGGKLVMMTETQGTQGTKGTQRTKGDTRDTKDTSDTGDTMETWIWRSLDLDLGPRPPFPGIFKVMGNQ